MGRWVGTDLEPTFQFKEKYGSKTARWVSMLGKQKKKNNIFMGDPLGWFFGNSLIVSYGKTQKRFLQIRRENPEMFRVWTQKKIAHRRF